MMFQGLRRCAAAAILAAAVFGFPAMALAQDGPPPCDIPQSCAPGGTATPPPSNITWSGMSTADGQQIKGILDGDGLSINKDGTWLANAQRDAKKLFKLLFPLEIAVTGIILLFRARDWGDAVSNFTLKLLAGTCFLVLISNAGVIFNAIPAWFAGEAMSITGYEACATWLTEGKCDKFAPGSVVAKGVDVAGHMNAAFGAQLDKATAANQGTDNSWNPIDKVKGVMAGLFNGVMLLPAIIMLFLADIIVMAAYLVMAATLAITQVEAQILGAVGAVVLGFAAFRYTNSYSEKFISLAFSVGGKLFLIYVMLAVTDNMMAGAVKTLLAGEGVTTVINPLAILKVPLVAIFAMILVWKIPQLASSFSSGTTGMNLGGVISSSLAIAGAALAATGAGAAMGAKGAAAINEKMNGASLAKAAGGGAKAEPATAPVSDPGRAGAAQGSSSTAGVQPGANTGAPAGGGDSQGGTGGGKGSPAPDTAGGKKQPQPPFKPASGGLPDVKGSVPNSVPTFADVGGDGTGEAPAADGPDAAPPETGDREAVTAGGGGGGGGGGQRGGGSGGPSTADGAPGGGGPQGGGAPGGGAPPDTRRLTAAMERVAAHFEAGGGIGGGGAFTPADLSRAVAQGVQQSSLAEKIGHSVGSAVNPRRNRPPAPNRLMALSYKLSDMSDFARDPKHLNLIETLAMGTAVAGQHGTVSGHNTGASI